MASIDPTVNGSDGRLSPSNAVYWGWNDNDIIGWNDNDQMARLVTPVLPGSINPSSSGSSGSINPT